VRDVLFLEDSQVIIVCRIEDMECSHYMKAFEPVCLMCTRVIVVTVFRDTAGQSTVTHCGREDAVKLYHTEIRHSRELWRRRRCCFLLLVCERRRSVDAISMKVVRSSI
jgi:hypothetical protein